MRGVPRWLAVLAVVAITLRVVCAFTIHRALTPAAFVLRLSDATIPADGFTSTELKIRSSNGRDLRGLQVAGREPSWRCSGVHDRRGRFGNSLVCARACCPARRSCASPLPVSLRRRSCCRPRSTPVTPSAMARRTFSACTILPTARHFAAGSPCWRNRSTTAGKSCRPRSTTALRCCALPIARLCASTMRHGPMPCRCLLRRRRRRSAISVSVHAAGGCALSGARRRLRSRRSWRRRVRAVR